MKKPTITKTIEMPYCLPGCVGDDCIYRLPDTETRETHTDGLQHDMCSAEPFVVVQTIPRCAKAQERETFRMSVFDAAWKAIEHAGDSCETLHGKITAEKVAWDEYARQWWDGPCPFYSAQLRLPI